jgi:hypothetical protein
MVKSIIMFRFTALENLNSVVDVNGAWKTIEKNVMISAKEGLIYYELKKHEQWFSNWQSDNPDVIDFRNLANLAPWSWGWLSM